MTNIPAMNPSAAAARLPNPENDWRATRCGHNFEILNCPYERCDARDGALTECTRLLGALREPSERQIESLAICLGIGMGMAAPLFPKIADWLEANDAE